MTETKSEVRDETEFKSIKIHDTQVMVFTDMEPDDMHGIYGACKMLPKCDRIYGFVVGEGNAPIKVRRMTRYCELLQKEKLLPLVQPKVILGLSSSKLFSRDGAEFNMQETKSDKEKQDVAAVMKQFKEDYMWFLNGTKNPVLWILKPPRELLALWVEAKSQGTVKDWFGNTTVVMYGSFNLRNILDRNDAEGSRKRIYEFLASFKQVYLYESFHATGSKNSIDASNMPALFKTLNESKSEYLAATSRLVRVWNECNLDNCNKACQGMLEKYKGSVEELSKNKADKTQYDRKLKAAKDIAANISSQMVLADQAMLMLHYYLVQSAAASAQPQGPPGGLVEKTFAIAAVPVTMTIDNDGYTVPVRIAADSQTKTNLYLYMSGAAEADDASWKFLEIIMRGNYVSP